MKILIITIDNKYNLPSSFYIDKELYNTLNEKDWEKLEYLSKIAIYKYPNDAIGYLLELDSTHTHAKKQLAILQGQSVYSQITFK